MLTKNTIQGITLNPQVDQIDLESRRLLELGQQRGWQFILLGQAPLPERPVRLGYWLIVPAMEDSSEIPDRAMKRIQAIFAAGLRPKGFVLVHEAPKLLPGSISDQDQKFKLPLPDKEQLAGILGVAVSAIAVISTLIVSSLATLTAGTGLLAAAVLLDPILVAVTEDDLWVEIDRWWH